MAGPTAAAPEVDFAAHRVVVHVSPVDACYAPSFVGAHSDGTTVHVTYVDSYVAALGPGCRQSYVAATLAKDEGEFIHFAS